MELRTYINQTSEARTAFYQVHQQLFRRLLKEGQSPQIMFISCNDSRVIPEAITGAEPGELFVLRNLANIVPPYGTGEHTVGATIEFAVSHLEVQHIIICGHTDCGGIKTLDAHLDQLNEPHFARWIEYARSAQTQVDAWGVNPEERHRAIVERNVLVQMDNLRTYDMVVQGLKANELSIYGWVYDLSTGRISQWDGDIGQFVDESEV